MIYVEISENLFLFDLPLRIYGRDCSRFGCQFGFLLGLLKNEAKNLGMCIQSQVEAGIVINSEFESQNFSDLLNLQIPCLQCKMYSQSLFSGPAYQPQNQHVDDIIGEQMMIICNVNEYEFHIREHKSSRIGIGE